jgi:lipopolysaccharide biosynthesis protein
MFKFLFLNIFSKHRLEKFFREIRVNGLRSAIGKVLLFLRQARQPLDSRSILAENRFDDNGLNGYFSELFKQAFRSRTYLPFKQNTSAIPGVDIKLIAFYLPQFHPVKENDEWWGKGFTEWTNVSKAVPQFIGHYQPHLPDQLGFYDLRLKSVQLQQIELAKQYGIYGFCYHHYWFDKKRILDTPLDNVLKNPELDLPFCINWANENWTRRWDGLEQDVLLAQRHSAEDDIAFITDAARYMRDKRYIRIDGRPLLMLYRPGLLPDVRATAQRWREWCRENAVGEIYLVATHAFEHVNPADIGFDAAVEYSPNTYPMLSITEQIATAGKIVNPDYRGIIFDYNQAADYGENCPPSRYKKFRCLFPGWDNESRRPGRGITYIHSSPLRFHRWLSCLLRYTQQNFKKSEQLVFINAWNEWAEGAHLEPDRKYGFGYLEACRIASQLHQLRERKSELALEELRPEKNIAVVIHAFYLDVLDEILGYLATIEKNTIKLFVTTPEHQLAAVNVRLTRDGYDFVSLGVTNRGRDILPFLKILPEIIRQNFAFLVKVHTKKSTHRTDGDFWRNDLYAKLLDGPVLLENIRYLRENSEIGILAPENHLVSMDHYLASNADNICMLAARLGTEMETVMRLCFVAGTMFSARVHALMPLLLLNLDEEEFEPEQGQVDGTLAHAIERLFAISASSIGYQVVTRNGEVADNYPHAEKTTQPVRLKLE